MKKKTRFAFNAYLQQLARLNGVEVEELSSKFTVEPSVQQTLEDQIQQTLQQVHRGAVRAADAGRPDPAVRSFPDAD